MRLLCELDNLKEKTIRNGHTQFAARLSAMSQAARQAINLVTTELVDSAGSMSAGNRLEINGPPYSSKGRDGGGNDVRQRKTAQSLKNKNKVAKNNPGDSGTHIFYIACIKRLVFIYMFCIYTIYECNIYCI